MEYYSVLKRNELKRSLTWTDDPGLFRWDQCNHKGGRRVSQRRTCDNRCRDEREGGRFEDVIVLGLKMKGP